MRICDRNKFLVNDLIPKLCTIGTISPHPRPLSPDGGEGRVFPFFIAALSQGERVGGITWVISLGDGR
jgi:hypothetical protein